VDDYFWLYVSNDVVMNDGECRGKDDESLTCLMVKGLIQCPLNGVKKIERGL
jgi:hypothetical protein